MSPSSQHTTNEQQTLAERFPQRITSWQLRSRCLPIDRCPLLMGIINVTPDSFSDGGRFVAPQAAVDRALQLIDQGADIIDVGGESTRPYATPVDADEELRRVIPVIEQLAAQTATPISIDTSKPAVAREALAAGAEIINDITGLTGDPQMVTTAVEAQAAVCAMHMQGTPQTMQDHPSYHDVVMEIQVYLRRRRDELLAAGVARERLCLDPGIGFGKTHQHNLTLVANCWRFHALECPLLVGHSRKAFLGKVLGDKQAGRTAATVGVALALARQGVHILRVHDVLPVRQALLLFAATGGIDGREGRLEV